ncbi:MAG: GNAT family N-acetyltransferase [Desulfobulbia bacterium]
MEILHCKYEDVVPMWQKPEMNMNRPVSTMEYYEDQPNYNYTTTASGGNNLLIKDLAYSDPVYFHCILNDKSVGCISCHWSNRKYSQMRVRGIYVEPEARRQGIARKLLKRAIMHAASQDDSVCLWALAGPNSIPVHLQEGFRLVTRQYQGALPDANWSEHLNAYMRLDVNPD